MATYHAKLGNLLGVINPYAGMTPDYCVMGLSTLIFHLVPVDKDSKELLASMPVDAHPDDAGIFAERWIGRFTMARRELFNEMQQFLLCATGLGSIDLQDDEIPDDATERGLSRIVEAPAGALNEVRVLCGTVQSYPLHWCGPGSHALILAHRASQVAPSPRERAQQLLDPIITGSGVNRVVVNNMGRSARARDMDSHYGKAPPLFPSIDEIVLGSADSQNATMVGCERHISSAGHRPDRKLGDGSKVCLLAAR